tara:strand:+ start:12002 stop:12592 length:591 start_codon:yes stop_codon:yes gene_type:complete
MTLKLNGSSSGSISIDAPASTTGGADITLTLPEKGFGFTSYAVIVDRKANDAGGGTFTTGDWRTRDLNHEITDPDGIVSISSNQFTLAAGSYLIQWWAPAYKVNEHQSRLYDITNSAVIIEGKNSGNWQGSGDNTYEGYSDGLARVTPSGPTVYEIQHRCNYTVSNSGFGGPDNHNDDFTWASYAYYTRVFIQKEA